MYYMDSEGAITFTIGACVNKFTLEKDVKVLFSTRLVKLFKLFKSDKVHFSIGSDNIGNDIVQTKVKFENDTISISAILFCDDTMINSMPVTAIRNRVSSEYKYSVAVPKIAMLETINRLMLFVGSNNSKFAYGKLQFNNEGVYFSDLSNENKEFISFDDSYDNIDYNMVLDLNELKGVLDICPNQFVSMRFGDSQAVVIQMNNISYIISEVHDT